MKIPVLALTATLLSASALFAQTADKPPLLENDQIRVRELRFAPGSARRSEAKPNTFLYALTDGALVFTPPGRKGYELSFKAGEALWLPSQETATANEGDKEVRILAVEVKAKPPVAKKGRGKGKKGGKKGAARG